MNWKNVPIPDKMKDCQKDSRGFPIPYVIFWDAEGNPQFRINDDVKSERCLRERLCAICAGKLEGDMWLAGGEMSAFHPRGAYFDTPMHYDCGVYALKVCPYLASRNYNTLTPEEKMMKIPTGEKARLYLDPTQDPNRPEVFVFIKFSDFTINRPDKLRKYVVPKRPYEKVEFWAKGKKIDIKFPKELEHIVDPKGVAGIIPWNIKPMYENPEFQRRLNEVAKIGRKG